MRLAILTLALILAACSSSAGASTTAAGSPAAPRIDVKLTDALKIEPAAMTVPAGVAVTFVVTNAGATEHEFYLGDEAVQAAHRNEMRAMGGMAHDERSGIGVEPGATKELIFTFPAAGTTFAGCHVNAHYAAGMKAAITVTG